MCALAEHLFPYCDVRDLKKFTNVCIQARLPRRVEEERQPDERDTFLAFGAPDELAGDGPEDLSGFALRLDLGDHLAVVCRGSEELRIEGDDGGDLAVERLGELGGRDLGALGYACHVDDEPGPAIVRARLAQHVHQHLGVAEIGEVRRGDEYDLVGSDQLAARPSGPHMGHVEHDAWRGGAQQLDGGIEAGLAQVVDAVERGGRRQHVQRLGAFRQQPVEEVRIEPLRREHRLGDALGRILVEVEAGRAEAEIEIGDNRGGAELARRWSTRCCGPRWTRPRRPSCR